MFNWVKGRQEGVDYYKLKIFSFKLLKFGFDCYILKYNLYQILPYHFDKVMGGKHYRANITLSGDSVFIKKDKDGKEYPSRKTINIFRPDIEEHKLVTFNSEVYKLSIGMVIYE